jgi:hypothetical protein
VTVNRHGETIAQAELRRLVQHTAATRPRLRMGIGPAKGRGRTIHLRHHRVMREMVLADIAPVPADGETCAPATVLALHIRMGWIANAETVHAKGQDKALKRSQQGGCISLSFEMLHQLITGIGKQHRDNPYGLLTRLNRAARR